MSHIIHARRRHGEIFYRDWSTVVDSYITGALSQEEFHAYLLDEYSPKDVRAGRAEWEINDRMTRARERGSSSFIGSGVCDLDGPWKTERCQTCGRFHHVFVKKASGTCADCGEAESNVAHGPACPPRSPAPEKKHEAWCERDLASLGYCTCSHTSCGKGDH